MFKLRETGQQLLQRRWRLEILSALRSNDERKKVAMTFDERIMYAEEKKYEAIRNKDDDSIAYWVGYIDGLIAAKRSLNG